jgi:hypothetical protein
MNIKIQISKLTALLGILGVVVVTSPAQTIPQTQTVLQSYFVTGAVPTQTQYQELIGTMFWYANQTYSNSLVAASNSAALTAQYKSAFGAVPVPGCSGHFTAANNLSVATNCSYGGVGSGYTTTLNFAFAFPDTNYLVIGKVTSTGGSTYIPLPTVSKTTTNLVIDGSQCYNVNALSFGIYTNGIAAWIMYKNGFPMYP